MSILDINKTIMYKFQYDYVCYMDTDSFIIHIITEDVYKDMANDVERWFDTSNYDKNDNRSLPIGKNKRVISLFKDELRGKIVVELCALRAKTYAYLMGDVVKRKKPKE